MDTQIMAAILGGSAAAALINQIGESIRQRRKHRNDTESRESEDIRALKRALRYVLLDRIRYLGQAYIQDASVDFDDRRLLNEMHECYHSGLGGNGDLDQLMRQVNSLPLK